MNSHKATVLSATSDEGEVDMESAQLAADQITAGIQKHTMQVLCWALSKSGPVELELDDLESDITPTLRVRLHGRPDGRVTLKLSADIELTTAKS